MVEFASGSYVSMKKVGRGTPRCCEPACSHPPLPAPRRRPLCLPRPHLRRAVALLPLQIRAGTVALTSYRESGIQAARPRLGVEPLDDLILTAVVRKSPGPFGSGGGARLCREAPRQGSSAAVFIA